MNENSSKQVLLSVIGIAVLVVAVVGVSFAFFTYSKTGDRSNSLTTGSIFFNFVEGDAINLTNQFPMTDTSGMALSADNDAALTFSVTGYDGSGKGIDYTIYAIAGGEVTGRNRFNDDEIKLYLVGESALTNEFSTPKVIGSLPTSGLELATGKITANSSATQQTDSYTLRMWIDNGVTIGATGSDYTEDQFGNLYYSLRVKVVANTSTGA